MEDADDNSKGIAADPRFIAANERLAAARERELLLVTERAGIQHRASCGCGSDPHPHAGAPHPYVPLRFWDVRVVRVRVRKGAGK